MNAQLFTYAKLLWRSSAMVAGTAVDVKLGLTVLMLADTGWAFHGKEHNQVIDKMSGIFSALLTCSWVTGMSLCLESSLMTLRSVLMSNLQPTSTTLALGQNSCVSPCHCVSTDKHMSAQGHYKSKLKILNDVVKSMLTPENYHHMLLLSISFQNQGN